MTWDKKDKDKISIVCYECKKYRHFTLECPNLEKSQDKKKFFLSLLAPKVPVGLSAICLASWPICTSRFLIAASVLF